MHKLLILTAAIVALALISAPLAHEQAEAQKKKPKSCNNVKIHVNVKGVEENQTVLGVVTLNDRSVSRMGTVEVNETSINLPFNFKKVNCPVVGAPFSGFINGTEFSDEIDSLKKPNKVSVTLP